MNIQFWRPKNIRVLIHSHFGEPVTPAVARDLLSQALWDSAAKEPGARGDVRQIWLDNYTEPENDRLAAGKFPALGPGWRRESIDNDPADWESFSGPDEQRRISETIALYRDELAELDDEETRSEADVARQAELEELINNLQAFGALKAVPATHNFGDDKNAIYRALNAPNFAFRYRSKFVLIQGRPFTLWLRRFRPAEGQLNHYLQLGIGRNLRILFEKDKAMLYRVNRLRPEADWIAKDARRDELIIKKNGTREQHERITAWRDAIEQVKADYKGHKPSDEQKAQIKDLNRQIKELQDIFKLTEAEEGEIHELEKYLFTQRESVDLDQTSDSLVGEAFSLTFFDFGFGIMQIVCDIGRNKWIFQDKEILRSQQWQWLWGSHPDRRNRAYDGAERLEIAGNGGALLWRFGYVKTNQTDTLLGAPIYLGRSDLDVSQGLIVNGQWTPNLPAGNQTQFLFDPVPLRPGWYQMGVRFVTDGQYYPIVTRASMQVPAGAIPPRFTVWDSAAHPEVAIELKPKYSEKRGVIWDVIIHNKEGIKLNLPDRLYERCCSIIVEDLPVMSFGLIAEQTHDDLERLTPHTEGAVLQNWSEVLFSAADKLRIARHKRFPADFTFDGMFDNDVVRVALQSIGFNAEELSLIEAGTGYRMPETAPGESPLLKPDKNVRVLDFLENEIIEKVGLDKQIFVDSDGYVRYEDPALRVRSEIPYAHAANASNTQRPYFAGSGKTIQRIWNTDGYFTQLFVEGDTNPETKKPYSASHTIREAVDPAFGPDGSNDPRFIGHHKPKETMKEQTLNSQAAVERALATQIKKYGYPKPEWRLSAPFDADVLPGDRLMIENRVFTLIGIPSPELEHDEMEFALEEVIGN